MTGLKLHGRVLTVIDWANVHGWEKSLKWAVDPQKLFEYLSSFQGIIDRRFYFGTEAGNEHSEAFQKTITDIGYTKITKEVKWVPDGAGLRRKCDFDVEITRDVLNTIHTFDTLLLFSGDGDYAPLIEDIISKKKKGVLVFARGHIGKEFEFFKQGLFLCSVNKLKDFISV